MASNLLGEQDRLFKPRHSRNLAKLRDLHVLQPLRVFGQAHRAHAPLDVIHKPPLAINRDDWDILAGNQAAVFQNRVTAQDVFPHPAPFDFLLPDFAGAKRLKRGL